MQEKPEVWMRGPVERVPSLLQPVAHALLQAREDAQSFTQNFPDSKLWVKPSGSASVGFHLEHMAGVLDRMLTYSLARPLNATQLEYLSKEGVEKNNGTTLHLVQQFQKQIDLFIEQLAITDENTLLEPRGIGRKQIPSNVLGLLFHAAEHIQRHTGQLLVTIRVLNGDESSVAS